MGFSMWWLVYLLVNLRLSNGIDTQLGHIATFVNTEYWTKDMITVSSSSNKYISDILIRIYSINIQCS